MSDLPRVNGRAFADVYMDLSHVELEVAHLVARCELPTFFHDMPDLNFTKSMIDGLEVTLIQKVAKQSFVEELRKEVTQHVDFQVSIPVPKTWWQMFKKKHFPKWLLNKFPVEYSPVFANGSKEVTFHVVCVNTADVYYPKMITGQDRYIRVMQPTIKTIWHKDVSAVDLSKDYTER
jgi:hypothetical protein